MLLPVLLGMSILRETKTHPTGNLNPATKNTTKK
jgi:hypothetical protein